MKTPESSSEIADNRIKRALKNHNAVGAAENLIDLSIPRWKKWIKDNIPDFSGNRQNAARLLYETSNGLKYVRDRLKSKGLSFYAPLLVILFRGISVNSSVLHSDGYVCITQELLEHYSKLSMSGSYELTRPDRQVFYRGTIPDWFRLIGVEESHHAVFEQFKGKQSSINPLSKSPTEYDARINEYHALRWQLRYAREQNMQQITIQILEKRLTAARAIKTP